MFWVLTGFGKISISAFDQRILIPMPKLLLQTDVAWDLVIFGFSCALRSVLVIRGLYHSSTSCSDRACGYERRRAALKSKSIPREARIE
jgi:hypothetical protein